jgi:hypothetical protein
MLYLYGYNDIKAFDQERRARALVRAALKTGPVIDSYVRPKADAEVVEVFFGAHCDQIGA